MTADVGGDRCAQQQKYNAKSKDGWNVLHVRIPRVGIQVASRPQVPPARRCPVAGQDVLERPARENVDIHPVRSGQMIGEGKPLNVPDSRSKLDHAKEAVQAASRTVKETTQSVTDAIEAGRRPGAPLDRLAQWTREAPLPALALAFMLGVLIARRRG
jgi:hypothetical protein